MYCPYCKHLDTSVIDSRDTQDGQMVRRRRVCEQCQRRFTTYERIEGIDIKVIKKSGNEEDFDREKIKRGLMKATWKRPVSVEQIEELISDVENKIRARSSGRVKSWEVGNLVINRLKKLDKLSYLLFACVYRDFDSLVDFEQEIMQLKKYQLESN